MSSKSEVNPNLKWIMEELERRFGTMAQLSEELPESLRKEKSVLLVDELSVDEALTRQPSPELSTAPRVLDPAAFAVAEEQARHGA